MRWKLDVNEKYKDIKVTIEAPKMTHDISRLTTFIDQLSHSLKKEECTMRDWGRYDC